MLYGLGLACANCRYDMCMAYNILAAIWPGFGMYKLSLVFYAIVVISRLRGENDTSNMLPFRMNHVRVFCDKVNTTFPDPEIAVLK